MPVSAGKCSSKWVKASSPPADAPMPTMGKAGSGVLGDGAVEARDFLTGGGDDLPRAADFCFRGLSLPRDSLPGFFMRPDYFHRLLWLTGITKPGLTSYWNDPHETFARILYSKTPGSDRTVSYVPAGKPDGRRTNAG